MGGSYVVGRRWAAAPWAGCLTMCLFVIGAGCADPQPTTQPAAEAAIPGNNAAKRVEAASNDEPDEFLEAGSLPGRIHIVQPGDTLWTLAERYYGHGKHLHKIHVANRNRLRDPNNLPVGMKLIIP